MRFKYPRTPHLPWSLGLTDDDAVIQNINHFEGKEVVVTEKLDGENTTLYTDYMHARSIDGRSHPSREWLKQFHGNIGYLIPPSWRFCGEYLYARHSIAYDQLESYFYLFSIWDEKNVCQDWLRTLEWAELIGLKTPKEFYRGLWDEKLISQLSIDSQSCEGYVVRTMGSFSYDSFSHSVAKWVRKNHVQTEANWMHQKITPNRLI